MAKYDERCDVCGTDEMMEWFTTECCGGVCTDCYQGTRVHEGYRGSRTYEVKPEHTECSQCYEGIEVRHGRELCRNCLKEPATV